MIAKEYKVMSKYLLGLMGLALLGGSTLLAQTPQAGPKREPIPAPAGPKGEPLPPPIVSTPPVEACGPGGCCPKTKTVCCPEHYIKEKEKVVHTFGCEKKCLPYCHGLCHHGCDDSDHGRCGHAIHVRYLVKKVQVCEHEAVKCNPVEVPKHRGRGCANGSCGASETVVIPTEQPVATQPAITVVPNKK